MSLPSDRGTKLVFDGKISQPDLNATVLNDIRASLQGFDVLKPITLFPVRIETKYIPKDPESPTTFDLWVRIFPDQIHAKTHEQGLLQEEINAGVLYWELFYNGDDEELSIEKWSKLCISFGTTRAAYIIKVTKPEVEITNSELKDVMLIYTTLLLQFKSKSLSLSDAKLYMEDIKRQLQLAYGFLQKVKSSPRNIVKDLQKDISLFTNLFNHLYDKEINPWVKVVTQEEADREGYVDAKILASNGRDQKGDRQYHKGDRPYASEDREHPELELLKTQIDSALKQTQSALVVIPIGIIDFTYKWPIFPTKEHNYSEQPYSDILPDKFVVIGMQDSGDELVIDFIKVGDNVPEDLKLGSKPLNKDTPDNDAPFSHDIDGNIVVEDSINWMFDLSIAKQKGMAIQIQNAVDSYAKIVVFGIKSSSIEDSETALSELFTGHQYTQGLSLLNIGTPTNNTLEKESGYQKKDKDHKKSYAIYAKDELFQHKLGDTISDGQRISEALGVPYEVFQHVENANSDSFTDAKSVKKVLFPATLGNHMEEMTGTILNDDNRERIKVFFEDWATSRGTVPSFRIGSQPYGFHIASRLHNYKIVDEQKVLNEGVVNGAENGFDENPGEYSFSKLSQEIPQGGVVDIKTVGTGTPHYFEHFGFDINHQNKYYDGGTGSIISAFNLNFTHEFIDVNLNEKSDFIWQKRFEVRLKEMFVFLDVEWRKVAEISAKNVYIKNIEEFNAGDPKSHFMEIFGRQAHSVKYAQRHVVSTGSWHPNLDSVDSLEDAAEFVERRSSLAQINNSDELRNFLVGSPLNDPTSDSFDHSNFPKGIYDYSDQEKLDTDHPWALISPKEYLKKIDGILALRTTNSSELRMLNGDVIYNGKSQESNQSHMNYVNELLTNNPSLIYNNNELNDTPNTISNLLLRTALLLKYREVATKTLIAERITDKASINRLGSVEQTVEDGDSEIQKSSFTGYNGDSSLAKNQRWYYTKWNVLFDLIYGQNMYMLNSSELSPWGYLYKHLKPEVTYTYWQMLNFDFNIDINELSPAWKANLLNDGFRSEFAVSKLRYDKNELIKYLRPVINSSNIESPYIDSQINNSDYENTFFKLFFGPDIQGQLNNFEDIANIYYSDVEINNLPNSYASDEISDFFSDMDPSNNSGKSMADYLFSVWEDELFDPQFNQMAHSKYLDDLLSYKSELSNVASINPESFSRMMGETMDLSSFRLDGWIQGMYAKRLHEIRSIGQPKESRGNFGSYIGAYGYVENLSRTGENDVTVQKTLETEIPKDFNSDGPVYADHDSDGFILTPSITHAVTASILRSGYLTSFNLENSNVNNRLSVNLSSKRVRLALDILNGVRSGQELGAVLGYQFENGLHERSEPGLEMDVFIHRLRKRFPLEQIGSLTDNSSEQNRSGAVIDGLALVDYVLEKSENIPLNDTIYTAYESNPNYFDLNIGLTSSNFIVPQETNKYKIFLFELNELIQSFDALADLVVSEGVFQIAGGNFDRANAFLTSMTGNRAFSDPDVIDLQRTGNSFYNKLVLNFRYVDDFRLGIPQQWEFDTTTSNSESIPGLDEIEPVIAMAKPSLNKWVGELLGDPTKIVVNIEYKNVDDLWVSEFISLAQLKIQPLGLLQLLAVNPSTKNSEIGSRLVMKVREIYHLDMGVDIKINFSESQVGIGKTSLYNYLPLLDAIREIINNSQNLGANDFEVNQPNGVDSLGGYELSKLIVRINNAISKTESFLNNTPPLLDDLGLETLKELSTQISEYGIPGAIPLKPMTGLVDEITDEPFSIFELEKTTYSKAVANSLLILNDRFTRATSYMENINYNNEESSVLNAVDNAARTLFGKTFKLIPAFKLRNGTEVIDAINNQNKLFDNKNNKKDYLSKWIHQLARVKKPIESFESLVTFSEIYSKSNFDINVIQIPYIDGDFWVGSEYPNSWKPKEKVNIVIHDLSVFPNINIDLDHEMLVGLKVEDWLDTIPDREIVAGIAFNYNAPNAEPPQTIIQAIPTDIMNGAKWKLEDLFYTIIETIDMAKYRAVDNDDIMANNNWLGKLIPSATFEAFSSYDTSFSNPPTDSPEDNNKGTGMRFDPDFSNNNE